MVMRLVIMLTDGLKGPSKFYYPSTSGTDLGTCRAAGQPRKISTPIRVVGLANMCKHTAISTLGVAQFKRSARAGSRGPSVDLGARG